MKKIKIISIISISALILIACGADNMDINSNDAVSKSSTEASEQAQPEESTSISEQSSEIPKYSLNEPVMLYLDNSADAVAEVNVMKVTDNIEAFPDYLKDGDYFDVEKLIMIHIEYKNISYPENISFGLHDFQVFSESGKQLPNISQQNGGDSVAQGRTATSEFYVESEENQDTIELDFLPDSTSSPVATYSVNVEH